MEIGAHIMASLTEQGTVSPPPSQQIVSEQFMARQNKYVDKERLELSKDFGGFGVIKHPHTTESAMKQVEDFNTLIFICDLRATKSQIRKAVRDQFHVKAAKINTLITPGGKKKAYVHLDAEDDALELANKIGII